MLLEVIKKMKQPSQKQQTAFEDMAHFIDMHLPDSLGWSHYNIITHANKYDVKTLVTKYSRYTQADWRDFFSNNVVKHMLNTETGLYAQSSFREIMLQAAKIKSINKEDIAFLKQMEPMINQMAQNQIKYMPLLIEPVDVTIPQQLEELETNHQSVIDLNNL